MRLAGHREEIFESRRAAGEKAAATCAKQEDKRIENEGGCRKSNCFESNETKNSGTEPRFQVQSMRNTAQARPFRACRAERATGPLSSAVFLILLQKRRGRAMRARAYACACARTRTDLLFTTRACKPERQGGAPVGGAGTGGEFFSSSPLSFFDRLP